jgi:hypothetical protein
LLDARFRPSPARDGEDEIRCRPCSSLARPLSLGGPFAVCSEGPIGLLVEPSASSIMSGIALAMIDDRNESDRKNPLGLFLGVCVATIRASTEHRAGSRWREKHRAAETNCTYKQC